MTQHVSLSANGLKIDGGLDCPAGGPHDVPEAKLAEAVARKGGTVTCVKCRQTLRLVHV